MKQKTLFLLSFWINILVVCAQQQSLQLGYKQGYILNNKAGHLIEDFPVALTAKWESGLSGERYWHQLLQETSLGIELAYFDYRSRKLGKTIHLARTMNFSLFSYRFLELGIDIGCGLAYASNSYSEGVNIDNNAFGSPVLFHLQGGLQLMASFRNFQIEAKYMLDHFSNGAISTPNSGLNVINSAVSVGYRFGDDLVHEPFNPKPFTTENKLFIRFGGGIHDIIPYGFGPFPFATAAIEYHRVYHPIHRWFVGLEGIWSGAYSFSARLAYSNGELPSVPYHGRIGLFPGYELGLDPFAIFVSAGVYVFKPYDNNAPFFQRYGLKYYITDKLFLTATLRTHRFVAEFVETSISLCVF